MPDMFAPTISPEMQDLFKRRFGIDAMAQAKQNPMYQQLNNFQSQLPNMDMINRLFNISAGNLGSRMATERGRAQNTAGAIAGSRGYANPGSFITGAGNTAASPFIQALGGLEEGRARAQTQLPYQNLQAILPFLQMLQQQSQFDQQRDDSQAGFFDYLKLPLSLGSLTLPGGGSLFGKLLFPSLYKG